MTRIGLDALETAIAKELEDFAKDTTDTMRSVVEEVTEEAIETLKTTSPKKTGSYGKGWKSKATIDTNTGLTKTIHNRTPGLTHLLEDGHAKQNGGRVAGRKHIAPVEKAAIKTLEDKLRQRL
ncbi:TPA: HK97 gp10 family phage protein [Streptococcus suis]|nr:HK97 gp10 family phage protein [Streptococcus suis]